MAETVHDKIMEAIATPERRLWLDPADCSEIAEDVARALGFAPDAVVDTDGSGRHRPDEDEGGA